MNQTHAYSLAFLTDRNSTLRFSVPRANPGLLDAEVAAAMQGIINSDVVLSQANGEPRQKQSAELVTTERTEFEIFS